jgi:hypothetical protein
VVSAWGHLEVHADGLRAQFARVEALAEPETADARLSAAVRAIAGRLEVPLVAVDELPDVAEALGGTLPAELRARPLAPR